MSRKTSMALWLLAGAALAATPTLIRRKMRPVVFPRIPVVRLRFQSGDGVELAGDLYASGREEMVILVHGFTSRKNSPKLVRIAERMSRDFDVLAIDLRGHGESGGAYDLSLDAPTRDVVAAVRLARSLRYRKIALVGFSLGAASSVMAAAELGDLDALVSIACPAAPLTTATWHMAGMHLWRGWAYLMGTRIKGTGWWREFPVDVVERVGAPTLVVHCGKDGLIPLALSRRLFEAARDPKEFLLLPGEAHADLGPDGEARVQDWLKRQLRDVL